MTESEHAIPAGPAGEPRPSPLKQAIRQARIEAAERTGVVVDLRDAELARLELLNEALDPVFADIPAGVEVFDRGITKGDSPRLWVDMVAHVSMGRDKRVYRFLQDTRFGRRVLAESAEIDGVVKAITQYVARRLVERERALSGGAPAGAREARHYDALRRRRIWRMVGAFALGVVAGALALLAAAWFLDPLMY
jgi:hypothetical protein